MADQSAFEVCANYVIDQLEGGDHLVEDSGGLTRWGISSKAHPTINVRTLTRGDALVIYLQEYWKPASCGDYSWPLDLVVFDAAVNQGVFFGLHLGQAAKTWQDAVLLRMQRYVHIAYVVPSERQYFRSWIDRLDDVTTKCRAG